MQGFLNTESKKPASKEHFMYRNRHNNQTTIYDFILPFGGHLKKDNRWVVLREQIDWNVIEEEYSRNAAFTRNESSDNCNGLDKPERRCGKRF